jgi:anthranilate/para-aminobenzoate synthase component II
VTGNKDVILLDFNDSFTYNVASELYTLGIKTEVIPLDEIPEKLRDLIECDQKKVIIYGPGPGHPDDYKNLFHLIKRALKKTNLYHVGICLGHQLLWRAQGFEVTSSKMPVHGGKFDFKIPFWPEFEKSYWGESIPVQRYNSLVVKGTKKDSFAFYDDEIMASRFKGGVSFQFHPESIGTGNPKVFFNSIKNFLMEST